MLAPTLFFTPSVDNPISTRRLLKPDTSSSVMGSGEVARSTSAFEAGSSKLMSMNLMAVFPRPTATHRGSEVLVKAILYE